MEKPLLYYQFDLDDFRQHQYAAGYFDYSRDGFGPVCSSLEEVEDAVGRWLALQKNENRYLNLERRFFMLHDRNNCQRNFEAIRDWKEA